MFKNTLDNKKYHTLNYFYKKKFNTKISKISLNAGFSCPNLISGGCIYCSESGSGDFAGSKEKNITNQFNDIKAMMDKKWNNTKHIAYFQARTNTYAPLHLLKANFEEALKQKNVIGLNVATRADSITNECLDYLEELNKKLQEIGTEVYQQAQAAQQPQGEEPKEDKKEGDEKVVDAEFEEKDDKKK